VTSRTRHGHGWRDFSLTRQVSRRAVRRARIESLVLLPTLLAVLVAYDQRTRLLGREWDQPARVVTAVLLVSIGWQLAGDVGRAVGPTMFQRLTPATAGTLAFAVRLTTMLVVVTIALRVAGLDPHTLALGGALTAVVVGLAAQQTLGNLIAGTVLISARTVRVGDRIRLQGGPLAGSVEGVVSSLGLLYIRLAQGEDAIMIPNAVVLNVALIPLREPDGIHVRARLRAGLTPADVQELLERTIQTPVRGAPRVDLEELDGDEVVVRITATPVKASDGARLASEVVRAVSTHAVVAPT
jgi:small conductance mechanosensitive channel